MHIFLESTGSDNTTHSRADDDFLLLLSASLATRDGSVCVDDLEFVYFTHMQTRVGVCMCTLVDVNVVCALVSSERLLATARHRHPFSNHHPIHHGLVRYFQVSQPTSTRKRSRFEYTPYKESLRRAAAGKGPRASSNNSVLINGVSVSVSRHVTPTRLPAISTLFVCFF